MRGTPERHEASRRAPAYPIGSVDNALRLLKLFKRHEQIRVAEAAKELGVARSTADRLLAMLAFHGLLTHDLTVHCYVAEPEFDCRRTRRGT